LVTTAKAGEIARPGDAVSIAAAAERLADMSKENLATMAEAGAAFYRNNLSQAAGIAATDRVLRQAVAT
jgi:glycosyltransferase involved in cell wall biosynthesis